MLPALITYTSFQNHPIYIIPNKFDGAVKLSDIVLNVQTQLLKDCLGEKLYQEITRDWTGTAFITQKWIDFVDGYDYFVEGIQCRWEGFKDMLKYFVYYQYQKYNFTQQSAIAKVDSNLQNATKSLDVLNEIAIYNQGIELYGFDYLGIHDQVSYRNLRKLFYTEIERLKPTCYNFIYNRQNEFVDWKFKNKFEISDFI